MKNKIEEKTLDMIADALVDEGFIVLDDLMPLELLDGLCLRARSLEEDDLQEAQIGRGEGAHLVQSARSDKTHWIDGIERTEED